MDKKQEKKEVKLKPVILFRPNSDRPSQNRQNTAQQIMLIKAMQVTSDPKKLREMIGVRTVAEVYRTLDKIAIRKEFHGALDRAGISFDFIVNGIQRVASTADKDSDRLKAFEILLKTLGLDKYEESAGASSSWEEELLKAVEKTKSIGGSHTKQPLLEEYSVTAPKIPDEYKTDDNPRNL